MKWLYTITILTLLFIISCGDDEKINIEPIPAGVDTASVSACILDKVAEQAAKGDSAQIIGVDQYYYQGGIVYLYTYECCDQFNVLVNEECKPICAPSGGIGGNGDGGCTDFADRAHFIKLVWHK